MCEGLTYPGTELDLFARAANWKRYWSAAIDRYVRGAVLEVGAGNGANTVVLRNDAVSSWTCLEPDEALATQLSTRVARGALPKYCAVIRGTLEAIVAERFDTIIYIDVLEHVADDQAEVQRARESLRAGGHLIVLAPAHQWLFTPFDTAIGHFRRYTRETLAAVAAPGLHQIELRYLDSVGLLASLANRVVLRSAYPTKQQILVWDRLMVPVSRVLDPLLRYGVGKSVLGVWRREMPR